MTQTKQQTKYLKLTKAHNNNIKISDMNLKNKFTEFEQSKLDESTTLLSEINNKNQRFKRYSRGQIVKIKFGVNIGSEFSGDHYAIIISKKDTMMNPVIHVIPLTSKKHNYNVKINNILYNKKEIDNMKILENKEQNIKTKKEIKKCINYYENRKNKTSYACIKHLKTVSKLSICKPFNKYEYSYINTLKADNNLLSLIDNAIIQEYTI